MLTTRCLLAGALLIVGVMLSAAEVGAQVAVPPFDSPPRTCTVNLGGGKQLFVEAGPASGPGLAPTFPIVEPCPTGFSGTCKRWKYRWTFTGFNASHAGVSFDSDLTVLTTDPTAVVGNILFGDSAMGGAGQNVAGERFLRFNSSPTKAEASFTTFENVSTGTVTAVGRGGNTIGFCAIAGADNPSGVDPNLSQPVALEVTVLGCTVVYEQSSDGCVVSATVSPGGPEWCSSLQVSQTQTTPPTLTATCQTEFNQQTGSAPCTVKRWNSFSRTYTTITANSSPPCTP